MAQQLILCPPDWAEWRPAYFSNPLRSPPGLLFGSESWYICTGVKPADSVVFDHFCYSRFGRRVNEP